MNRNQLPARLKGATNFSDDRAELDPISIVRLLKWQKHIHDRLVQATTIRLRKGRKRTAGNWAIAYIAFVATRKYVDIEPWWASAAANDELWRECGFPNGRPAYQTVYDHFTELEQFAPEFQRTVKELVSRARIGSGNLVGRDVHVDSCEDETHARLVHDCQEHESCRRRATLAKRGGRGSASPAKYPERESTKYASGQRRDLATEHPLEVDEKLKGVVEKMLIVDDKGREVLRVRMNGCWYRSLDPEAGLRAYKGQRQNIKFWHGYYNTKAVDHYTGAPLAIVVSSASIAEHHIYPELLHRVKETVGEAPRAVVADKGFSIESVFKANTEQGILTVSPFRGGSSADRAAYETDKYDMHGIPKCKHCKSEGVFVSFTTAPKPRILFTCSINCPSSRNANGKPQRMSIYCEEKWRFLLPAFRTSELYMALRMSLGTYERVHGYWRRRYHVGGTDVDNRPNRFGRATRQLRANAALVIEWLLICWREGWFGNPRRNQNTPYTRRAYLQAGGLRAYRRRQRRGQMLPRPPVLPGLLPPLGAVAAGP